MHPTPPVRGQCSMSPRTAIAGPESVWPQRGLQNLGLEMPTEGHLCRVSPNLYPDPHSQLRPAALGPSSPDQSGGPWRRSPRVRSLGVGALEPLGKGGGAGHTGRSPRGCCWARNRDGPHTSHWQMQPGKRPVWAPGLGFSGRPCVFDGMCKGGLGVTFHPLTAWPHLRVPLLSHWGSRVLVPEPGQLQGLRTVHLQPQGPLRMLLRSCSQHQGQGPPGSGARACFRRGSFWGPGADTGPRSRCRLRTRALVGRPDPWCFLCRGSRAAR